MKPNRLLRVPLLLGAVFSLFLSFIFFSSDAGAAASSKAEIGGALEDFRLKDTEGKEIALTDYRGKIVVIDFWSADCPISKRYEERLKALYSKFSKRGVVFLGIASNRTETREEIGRVAQSRGVPFPILLDPDHKVADDFGAETTPHIFIVDAEGILRYAGAIDNDSWFPKLKRRPYLEPVLETLVEGREPPFSSTPPFGCTIKRKRDHRG